MTQTQTKESRKSVRIQPYEWCMGMAQIDVNVLGSFAVIIDGQPTDKIDYAKLRGLLAFLVMEGPRRHTRSALCALLWPESPDRTARPNLSTALTQLRKVLGPDALDANNDTVQLAPALWATLHIDAQRFLSELEVSESHTHRGWHVCSTCAQKLRQAVARYHGDFLNQVAIDDSAPFEDWARDWREHLRQRALTAYERLIAYAEWHGELTQAIDYARQRVALDPLNEIAQRELIRLLALDGQPSAARSQYDYFTRQLADEIGPGAEPQPATQHLVTSLTNHDQAIHSPQNAKAFARYTPPPCEVAEPPNLLVGRETTQAEIQQTLFESGKRLVNLTGAPGIGKTRLALSLAHTLCRDFEAGALFIELASIPSADAVPSALLHALKLADSQRLTPDAQILAHLKDKHQLLVLDNFEHVLDAAPFIARIVAECPEVTCVVTSREPLRVRAEQVLPVPPLALADEQSQFEVIQAAPAVQLFAACAARVQPSFAITPANAAAIAKLCALLDGLPLALELVAAQADLKTPAIMLQELTGTNNNALLDQHGPRDLPARQRTLRNTLLWGLNRLSPNQRILLARLSVFVDGFTHAAVQAIASDIAHELDALSHSGWVQVRPDGRFALLEPIRQFAAEMLHAQESDLAEVQRRHAEYFAHLAEPMAEALIGPQQAELTQQIDAEHANLQAAIRFGIQQNQLGFVWRITSGLWRYWWRRGFYRDNVLMLEKALAQFDQSGAEHNVLAEDSTLALARTMAVRGTAYLAASINQFDRAIALAKRSLAWATQLEDETLIGASMSSLGLIAKDAGHFDEALRWLNDSIAFQQQYTPSRVRFPAVVKAALQVRLGQFDEAEAGYRQVLAWCERDEDAEGIATALRGLAETTRRQNRPDEAEALLGRAIDLCNSIGNQRGNAWAYQQMGCVERVRGNAQKAYAWFAQSLAATDSMGDEHACMEIIIDIALCFAKQGEAMRAATLLSGVLAAGMILSDFERSEIDTGLRQCQVQLSPQAYAEATQRGHTHTPEHTIAYAHTALASM